MIPPAVNPRLQERPREFYQLVHIGNRLRVADDRHTPPCAQVWIQLISLERHDEIVDGGGQLGPAGNPDHHVVAPQPEVHRLRHCHVGECGRPGRMRGVTTATPSYKGHRYPVEIINHCVWLYFRFPLSFREVEELMLVRGVAVSYETIRRWCAKFGQVYANQLRRRRPRPGDKWHLDEVFVGINGRLRYLWRAVDQHGNVLDVLVQSRRNAVAAKRFFRKVRPERGRGLDVGRAC